jgi:DNA-binding response OmpR family regulator
MSGVILVVDDSLTVRSDLHEAFTDAGMNCIACANLAEARRVLAEQPVALAVLDVLLPDGDGIGLLEEIRANRSSAVLPVLMLSTEAEVRDRIRGMVTGSSDYIGKPYDRDYVLARARQLLRRNESGNGDTGHSVLVVDDSVTFREALCEALCMQGYTVHSAASGEEGLRAAAAKRPDVVIVDSVLPGIDGATVVRKMRLDAALRDTPCIMLTGSGELGAELAALNSGADGFARKEEDIALLLARVAAVLRTAKDGRRDAEGDSLAGPKRILAIDDSPTYLDALADSLREEGYDVIMARSGEEALEMIAVQLVDCILLDRLMPGLGGTETCRRIKSTPALRDIPLIMLTGTEDRDAMIQGLTTGADDYVLKSSELEVLKARVGAQLRRRQFEEENRRVRMELLAKEMEAAEARAARELAESRSQLLGVVEQRNRALEAVNETLRQRQLALDETNQQLAAANQQLGEANRLKSEFLSTMSHELRTPLNAIIGFSELFKDGVLGELTADQHKYVSAILDSGEHLLQLINEVLDLSKIEVGKMELDLEAVDLNQLLADSLAVIRERATLNRIDLAWTPPERSSEILGDRRRVRQILYNLLSNAVKFTLPGGRVALAICEVDRQAAAESLPGFAHGVRKPLPPGAYETFVQISIADTGVGVSADDMARLFTPFTQLNSSLSRKAEGTGLGLAVVRQLVELHGGSVAMTSEPGQGSCFTVWLPLSEQGATLEQPRQLDSPHGAARMALVIEDDPHAAELVGLQLVNDGFDVTFAESVESAITLVDRLEPDLIILDLLLPGMKGWDFVPHLKGIPAWANVPVVVISVIADQCHGMALGAAMVMQKPVRCDDISACLHELGLEASDGQAHTVLAVDDDPAALELMATCLDRAGFIVTSACGGRAGLDAVALARPDLIVLDLLMPDVNGFDFIAALKSNPDTSGIPTIVVTASQPDEKLRRQLGTQILALVDKVDFEPRSFMEEVHRALRHREGAPWHAS